MRIMVIGKKVMFLMTYRTQMCVLRTEEVTVSYLTGVISSLDGGQSNLSISWADGNKSDR